LQPAGKTLIMFEEREAGAPEAVRAWFYPGENYGAAFVYPQPQAATIAKATNQAVPSMPAADKQREMGELQQVPVMTQQPGGEQTAPEPAPQPQAAAMPPQHQEPAPQPPPIEQEQPAQPQAQLPQTASGLPLIGLLGLLSLGLAAAFRLARKSAVR
jgi:hypothetical protein